MRSYCLEELFDDIGALVLWLRAFVLMGEWWMSVNLHVNGGLLLCDLDLLDFIDYVVEVKWLGAESSEATWVLGAFLCDVIVCNLDWFCVMGLDEILFNRLGVVFERIDWVWDAETLFGDDHFVPDGWVMEVLSEYLC